MALAAVWISSPTDAPPPSAAASPKVPVTRTPSDKLAHPGFFHHEILRIDQEGMHPNDAYEIVLDGWVEQDKPTEIADVRLWWLDTAKRGERSPFGKSVRKRVNIDYRSHGARDWTVSLGRGKRQWNFDVELDDKGELHAYGDIVDEAGQHIDHCRADSSKMVPKTLLGLPTGIDRVELDCVDRKGKRHRGTLETGKRR